MFRQLLPVVVFTLACLICGCQQGDGEGKRAPSKQAARRTAQQAAEKIQALPYLATAPVDAAEQKKVGVTTHLKGEAGPGLTVYCSEESDEVRWIDLQGKVRHQIQVPGATCKLVEPTGQGDILILGDGILTRVDLTGEVIWRVGKKYDPHTAGRLLSFHHDLGLNKRGQILALTNNNRLIRYKGIKIPIRDDEITVLSARGKRLRSTSLFDLFRPLIKPERLDRIHELVTREGLKAVGWDDITDVLHANTLELLETSTPLGRAGQVLVAVRYLDVVALLDIKRNKTLWSWGPGELEWPHHPSVLDNGHLLIFDNGSRRKWSRVIELDPKKGEVVWSYPAAKGDRSFFSDTRGSAQALPGGTVLITESDRGRIFEVSRQGKLVWEWWNPALVDGKKAGITERRLIYRATRYGDDSAELKALRRQPGKAPRPARQGSPGPG